ncbi:hypothetical protein ABHN05_13300 [Brevibacillus laterosporus]|uniref:hypothetical protein n=1 Tax=Brevibacillus laterosporus TaxID=1465 RepID=UPI001386ABB5|nr:hypothetical protein [Brevibacillus laterosporus]MED1790980.1 hypothetical protein [Brevibacillus laterosporus]MED4762064.1 hypothetical protein [Brevibacillus laterosporus]
MEELHDTYTISKSKSTSDNLKFLVEVQDEHQEAKLLIKELVIAWQRHRKKEIAQS